MNNDSITILLDKNAHRYARQFASEQSSLRKGKQVYLNTLAVCAVNSYLRMLSVNTALDRSDCWHPGCRTIFDTADLILPDLGKLECRSVLPGETAFLIPPEVTVDRLGYVVVRFQEELDRVELLGFINAGAIANPIESISLDRLQSLDALIDNIHRQSLYVNLRQWLTGLFEDEWQPTELLLANTSNFRSATETIDRRENTIDRAKIINLKDEKNSATVILAIDAHAESREEININLRIYPSDRDNYLPSQLEVKILDEFRKSCLEATSRDNDNYLELNFNCHSEEKFNININWKEISISEGFL
jgi:hypothetical protein